MLSALPRSAVGRSDECGDRCTAEDTSVWCRGPNRYPEADMERTRWRERCARCADTSLRKRRLHPTTLLCLTLALTLRGCDGECEFPAEWRGDWFQKGEPDPIRIGRTNISTKGVCREVHDNKFLVENPNSRCLRCIGIGAKHPNVLQYKETPYCSTHRSHEEVCREFTGDALLYSLFRLNGSAVDCPFGGPLSFEYSQGHGPCQQPASSIEACTDPSRLLLRFQACADVQGSESREEQLTCLGSWKEGSLRYLVGKLTHRAAKTDEDKFRCFVYEKKVPPEEIPVAQSGDATCDGLTSPFEGSRTMVLRKGWQAQEHCSWPDWLAAGRRWRTLRGDSMYELGSRNSSLEVSGPSGTLLLRLRCQGQGTAQAGHVQLLVHATHGCDNGYRCMRLYRRASHIAEMQMGHPSSDKSEACSSSHFDSSKAELVTLLREQPGLELEHELCPLAGTFLLEGPQVSRLAWDVQSVDQDCPHRSQLSSGCTGADRLELLLDCNPHKRLRSFQCHGSWEENGTHFLIASAMHNQRRYCIAFSDNGKLVHFVESPQACVHNVPWLPKEPSFAFNLTSTGECQEGNGATPMVPSWTTLLVLCLWRPLHL